MSNNQKQSTLTSDDANVLGYEQSHNPTLSDEVINEFIDGEGSGVTSPSQLSFDRREEVIQNIRSEIEKTIKNKWDIFEYSRLLDTTKISPTPTLFEIKKALMPYVRKGWYITVSFVSPKNNNTILTYEANGEFLSSNKHGTRDSQARAFIRLYPQPPQSVPFISNLIDAGKLFGIPAITVSAVATFIASVIFGAVFVIPGLLLIALSAVLFMQFYGDDITFRSKKKKKSKKNLGPLLWVDDIQGFKTGHRTITKEERIKHVIKTRVLPHEDE